MGDAEYTFAQAKARLEDIVSQVRKKDISLERSLDLLEEGVRLASVCTEQIDQSEWRAAAEEPHEGPNDDAADDAADEAATDAGVSCDAEPVDREAEGAAGGADAERRAPRGAVTRR